MPVYPNNWKDISLDVKEKAGWRCVRCLHPDWPDVCEELGIKRGHLPCDSQCRHTDDGKQRILTVHHLDMDTFNNAWWNLAALCQSCHLQIQGKVDMKRVWMFGHSTWFLPYVSGYYARLRGLPDDKGFVYRNLEELAKPQFLGVSLEEYPYYWHSRAREGDRWLWPCYIMASGAKRNVVVQFIDGYTTKTFTTMLRRRINHE